MRYLVFYCYTKMSNKLLSKNKSYYDNKEVFLDREIGSKEDIEDLERTIKEFSKGNRENEIREIKIVNFIKII